MDYELRVTTGGYISRTLAEIVDKVAPAIDLYPGYTFQSANVDGSIIRIYYADDTSESVHAEFLPAVPAIVWAVLAVLAILGIAYIAYELFVVAPQSLWGRLVIVAGAVTAIAMLVNAIRKRSEG